MKGAKTLHLRLAILAALAVLAAPSTAAADPVRTGAEHCVVNVAPDDPLNLRFRPGTSHRVLARLPYARCGLTVTAACKGDWCPVEDGHHAGWVHRHYIAEVSRPTHCLSPLARPQSVAVRAWPSEGSRVLARLAPESCGIALLPYQVEGWQKIRQGGWEGWLRLSDLLFIDG
jgi:SH3-like domain-containing protein